MADIINLRRVRKAKQRDERAVSAKENRRRFGRTKAEKVKEAAEREKAAWALDDHRRDGG
jgi:hypothetical protein